MKKYEVEIDNQVYHVTVRPLTEEQAANLNQQAPASTQAVPAPAAGAIEVKAPMSGNIWKIEVQPGQSVKAGDVLVILEAMKMENEIVAPQDGTVQAVHVEVNQTVGMEDLLVTLA